MIRTHRSIYIHVSHRVSAIPSRVPANPVRRNTTAAPLPDPKFLRSLSRDELIDALIQQQMGWLRDRAELVGAMAQEKDAILRDKDSMLSDKDAQLKTERGAVLLALQNGHKAELERFFYMERYKSLRTQYLRQEDRFNLRGIIEYIASTNPNHMHGVQLNLNDLSGTPEFARCLDSILERVMLPRDGVLRSCKGVYSMLSKHFHRHSVRGNCPELVIDTTPGHSQVFAASDGAALEAYLQLRRIPYLTICGEQTLQFEVAKPGQSMVGEEMRPGYQRCSWLDNIPVSPSDLSKLQAEPPITMEDEKLIDV